MENNDWNECAMRQAKYEVLKAKVEEIKNSGWEPKEVLAEIYNLFQESMISPAQEDELYRIADPEEKYNEVADYWFDGLGCLPIWECVQ